MKQVANLEHGGVLVELSVVEARALLALKCAAEGRLPNPFSSSERLDSDSPDPGRCDWPGLFGAIKDFVNAKCKVNELRRLCDEFDKELVTSKFIDHPTDSDLDEAAKTVMMTHHHPECGTKYRGCSPKCMKNTMEEAKRS